MLTRWGRLAVCVCTAAVCLFTALSCEKSPLFAPAGSTITLTSPTTVLSANGTATLIAQIIEPSGFPPHSGTRVLFTTTLGTLEPNQAETNSSGIATVTFRPGSQNGTAKITATSGTATTGTTPLSIAVGTAAVGRVTLTANPNVIQSNGGSSVVTASVLDVNGSALAGVPVSFSTSAGALSSSIATTDFVGSATTTLTTSTNATVTATVGVQSTGTGTGGTGTGGTGTNGSTTGQAQATVTITVNAQPTVSINPTTTGVLTAGTPITFAVTVQNASGSVSQIRNVTLNFGDGTGTLDLGALTGTAIPQQHVFPTASSTMTYTVRLTATDTLNATTSAATTVVIQPQPPLSASINQTRTVSGTDANFTFTATVIPNTVTIVSYAWDFGDGSPTQITTGAQTTHQYVVGSGSKLVSLTVTASGGQTATTSIFVTP